MAEPTAVTPEDPLIAALPPTTDYITYLTLLEYQLNSQNLSTLNKLLSEDDGSLAEEIGWDLLRLVLPMLTEVPETATACLELIARRGNPREVVIRIAEELEKLARDDIEEADESEDDLNDKNENDGLPTFPGEARRIHLGDMKLDGMPDQEEREKPRNGPLPTGDARTDTHTRDLLYFQSFLSMLCVVHPRIKTQYPSRFLATSLPASLGAYRRLKAPNAATLSYLDCLKKLSGKQKPPLPPRNSTNSIPTAVVTAPLPDPEAEAEASDERPLVASDNEKAIINRLLQAVLLEVLDEYMSALQTRTVSNMAWTERLREQAEPRRLVPGSGTQEELWRVDTDLRARDETTLKLVSAAAEVQIDCPEELQKLVGESSLHPDEQAETGEDEEPSEYPTSPSHIPISPTALVLLKAAQQFTSTTKDPKLDIEMLSRLFHLITPLSESPNLPNPAVQDALHSLLYQTLLLSPNRQNFDQNMLLNMVSTLTQAFTTNPNPQLRDDAHHLTTKLLGEYADTETRVTIIKQTLRGYTATTDPALSTSSAQIPLSTPLTQGSSMAVGVNWLKDEFLAFIKSKIQPHSDLQSGGVGGGINPSILETDTPLRDLLLPPVLAPPSPPPSTSTTADTTPSSDAEGQDRILLLSTFYISAINLFFVLLSNGVSLDSETLSRMQNFLSSMSEWHRHLTREMAGNNEDVKQSAADVFALEDAVGRLQKILELQVSSKQVSGAPNKVVS